jgi:hypothetical protein
LTVRPDRPAPDPATLNAAWDLVVRGDRDALDSLPPEDAAALRRLHTLYQPEAPEPSFVTRLEEKLMHVSTSAISIASPGDLNGRASWQHAATASIDRHARFSGWVGHLAFVVLVLVAVVGGWFALRPGQPDRQANTGYVATVGTPPATPAVTQVTTLLSAHFPAEWLTADRPIVQFVRLVFDPGASTSRPEGNFPAGARLEYVLEGRYAVQSTAPLHVIRGSGGPDEEVAPGTEVVLAAGDAVIHSLNSAEQVLSNPGQEPAVVLLAALVERELPAPPMSIEADLVDASSLASASPVDLELRHVTLAPGESLPGPEAGAQQLVLATGASGPPLLAENSDGTLENLGEEAAEMWLLVLFPAEASSPVASPAP